MKLAIRFVLALGVIMFASGVSASAAEEAPGPPQISKLEAQVSRNKRSIRLRAMVAPGGLSTSWTIYVSSFQPCGPVSEKPRKKREPKKVASGTIEPGDGPMGVSGRTRDSEFGARKFEVIARNTDGETTSRHAIPQDECHQE